MYQTVPPYQYHQVDTSFAIYWPSTITYWLVLPYTDSVPPSTNHCCHRLTQYTASSPRNAQLSQLDLVLCHFLVSEFEMFSVCSETKLFNVYILFFMLANKFIIWIRSHSLLLSLSLLHLSRTSTQPQVPKRSSSNQVQSNCEASNLF